MKVESKPTAPAQKPRQPFQKLITEARDSLQRAPTVKVAAVPPGLKVKSPAAASATLPATTAPVTTAAQVTADQSVRAQARAHADGEAQRLSTVRSDHQRSAESLVEVRSTHTEAVIDHKEARLIEYLLRELHHERPANGSTHHEPADRAGTSVELTPRSGQALAQTTPPEQRAAQAVALIEKIETFVKSQRPGLALNLNNSLGARVEIERIGPKEIALKLVGHRGPPSSEAVSRIRDELRARGLKVGALSIA